MQICRPVYLCVHVCVCVLCFVGLCTYVHVGMCESVYKVCVCVCRAELSCLPVCGMTVRDSLGLPKEGIPNLITMATPLPIPWALRGGAWQVQSRR